MKKYNMQQALINSKKKKKKEKRNLSIEINLPENAWEQKKKTKKTVKHNQCAVMV